MRYVIIGNSAAGIGTVEGIRQVDKDGEIIIITDEPYHTYSRPLISYLFLGKTTEEKMKYRSNDFYEKNNCTLLKSKKVTEIDPNKKVVITSDGDKIGYDKLLIGTGSSPFVPPMEGLDTVENKFTFMSLDDAKELKKSITIPEAKVLIIGAGLIGLKCAEGILNKVKEITVIDLAPNILSSILDSDGSKIVQKHLENKGFNFRLNQSVKTFSGNKGILNNGESIEFDVLVLAVGVRPNTQLAQNIGCEVNRGIVVNNKMETSKQYIYAAGDCIENFDVSSGQNRIMALLPNAYMEGECAGINMAGGDAYFDKAIPMNSIGFFGLYIITAGSYNGDFYLENDGSNYKKIFYEDNKLNGYILIGNVEKAGIYTSLIKERTPLDTIDFQLICQKPGLMAFTKEDRRIKLGGGINEYRCN